MGLEGLADLEGLDTRGLEARVLEGLEARVLEGLEGLTGLETRGLEALPLGLATLPEEPEDGFGELALSLRGLDIVAVLPCLVGLFAREPPKA